VLGKFYWGDDGSMGTVCVGGMTGKVGDGWGIVSSTFPGACGGIFTPSGGVDCANTAGVVMWM